MSTYKRKLAYQDPPRFYAVERLQICPVCAQMYDLNDPVQSEHHHSEIEYLVICEVCTQMYDRRYEEHARHHAAAEHQPLLTPPVYRYRAD